MTDPQEVIAACPDPLRELRLAARPWLWRDLMVDYVDDEVDIDDLVAALAGAGYHLCTEGQGVIDGEVVALEAGFVHAWDSFLGAPEVTFDPDGHGDYFRAVPLTDTATESTP